MTFELYDYGKVEDDGRSGMIDTIEAGSLSKAKEIARQKFPNGIALYLWSPDSKGFVKDAG
jgi:hypothetical protein